MFTDAKIDVMIVLFHNYFSPSGEQPKQQIVAYKSEQPSASCIAICHNIAAIKAWGYYNKFDSMKTLGIY